MELSVIDENNVNLLWEFPTKINKVLREKLAADKSPYCYNSNHALVWRRGDVL